MAAGRPPATNNLTARPSLPAEEMRHTRARLVWQRARRAARVLRRAAQQLRPAAVSTPRTVTLVQGLPPLGPRAEPMWQASAGLSATTVALGGEKGAPSPISRDCTR